MNDEHTDAEVDFEPEDELGETGAAKTKIRKLREELKEAQQKRDEYLDGWQRCKAEGINSKREGLEAQARAVSRGKDAFIEDLIPALDGFDLAMQGEAWNTVDKAWRSGIESIKSQIENVLKAHGVIIFGEKGDVFDPALHEPIQTAEGGSAHTVALVFRRGYRTKDRVLRPAQVSIYS